MTESTTLAIAIGQCPFCICSTVCQLKLENVVNPPQMPTTQKLWARNESSVAVTKRPISQPMRSEPAMFTAIVAHGSRPGGIAEAASARATEPSAPPTATRPSADQFMALSAAQGRDRRAARRPPAA